jgi:hypothetical protein
VDRRPKARARRCQTWEANVRVGPLGVPELIARNLFLGLNSNDKRIDIVSLYLEQEEDTAVKDLGMHFVNGFNICVENRNILMHSMTYQAFWTLLTLSSVQDTLTLQKSSRKDPTRTNLPTSEISRYKNCCR